jgi:putative hydrolase of HD superfamily
VLRSLHDFLRQLKDLPRTGWVQRAVTAPESVASHSLAVAVLAAVEAERRGLDPGRAALLAVVHDLPEAVVGDRVPGELPPEEKHRREAEAIRTIDAAAGAGGALVRWWEEYEAAESPEARLVRGCDLADATLQGEGYAAAGRVARSAVADLVDNCRGRIVDPALRAATGPPFGDQR